MFKNAFALSTTPTLLFKGILIDLVKLDTQTVPIVLIWENVRALTLVLKNEKLAQKNNKIKKKMH